MKVIDLLNKIANGEEVPKKIKYRDWLYEFEKYCNDYLCQYDSLLYRDNDDVKTFLNDEVEIIEEDNKIRKIYTFPGLDDYAYEDGNKPNNVKINNKMEELLIDKINEIIDYLEEKEWN